jgi:hypothetical protein
MKKVGRVVCLVLIIGATASLGMMFACSGGDNATTDDDNNTTDDDTSDDDSGQDVWMDPFSGLMWQNASNCCSNWDDSRTYCADLNWGGYSDWRMPTIGELRSLIRGCDPTETGGSCGVTDSCLDIYCWDDQCSGCSEFGGPGPGGAYWPPELSGEDFYVWSSSIIVELEGERWFVDFNEGSVGNLLPEDDEGVRCVR